MNYEENEEGLLDDDNLEIDNEQEEEDPDFDDTGSFLQDTESEEYDDISHQEVDYSAEPFSQEPHFEEPFDTEQETSSGFRVMRFEDFVSRGEEN
jgi:hypothetical protein